MSISPSLRTALEQFAKLERVLIASDFDGVLAPLVQNPLDSRAISGTLEALQHLSGDDGVCAAIVSGRDLATLGALTELDDSRVVLIGSHGAESSQDVSVDTLTLDDDQRATLDEVTSQLEVIAERYGARVEHKPAGVVLHTRGLANEDAAAAADAALALTDIPGAHSMSGKSVVEFSVVDMSKGVALTALAKEFGAQATFYMGDDVTDETAFTALPASGGNVTIKVGAGETAAAYRIDIGDVVSVLDTLVRLRLE